MDTKIVPGVVQEQSIATLTPADSVMDAVNMMSERKIGAVIITIPIEVLGGGVIIMFGMVASSAVSILAAMLSTLYIQILSLVFILFVYDVAFNPFVMQEIHDPIGCIAMILLSWFSGAAIGMVFLAAKPWFPTPVQILSTVYQRANMIASGKMFVANALPSYMLVMFDWNPLFHIIDQTRGFVFINYFPHRTSLEYCSMHARCTCVLAAKISVCPGKEIPAARSASLFNGAVVTAATWPPSAALMAFST